MRYVERKNKKKKCLVRMETKTGTKIICKDGFLRDFAVWGDGKREFKIFASEGWARLAIKKTRQLVDCNKWTIVFVYPEDTIYADGRIERG
jgi:hypothetical protein